MVTAEDQEIIRELVGSIVRTEREQLVANNKFFGVSHEWLRTFLLIAGMIIGFAMSMSKLETRFDAHEKHQEEILKVRQEHELNQDQILLDHEKTINRIDRNQGRVMDKLNIKP